MTRELHPGDPLSIFATAFAAAQQREPFEANAMVLSTVADGRPRSRVVLLKDLEGGAFVFHTNYTSAKGLEMTTTPFVALNFHWPKGAEQVRVEGSVEKADAAESDAYFASRPRLSQLGAWASDQSRPLDARETFEARLAEVARRFEGRDVERPPHWGGFRVTPTRIEFWYGRENRLHDRFAYAPGASGWACQRLFP